MRTAFEVRQWDGELRYSPEKGDIVRFFVGDAGFQWIDATVRDGELTLRAGRQLTMEPEVSNVIRLRVEIKP